MDSNGSLNVESSMIPQFDSLERILQAVEILRDRGVLTKDTIDLSHRHVNYVKHAARVLGLVSPEGAVTPVGRRALTLGEARRGAMLRERFEQSPCGEAWLKWSHASSIDGVDPASAESFLQQRSDLPPAMIQRRGRTLRRWCEQLRSASGAAAVETISVQKTKPRARTLDAPARQRRSSKSGAA